MFVTWLRKLFPTRPVRPIRRPRTRPLARPNLVCLEDRSAPAVVAASAGGVLTVTLTANNDAAFLRVIGGGGIEVDNEPTFAAPLIAGSPFGGISRIVVVESSSKTGTSVTFTGANPFTLVNGLKVTGIEDVQIDIDVDALGGATQGLEVTGGRKIYVTADVTTLTGGILLSATAGGAGEFNGVLTSADLISTGDITLTGKGGTTADDNVGVAIFNAATVKTEGTGKVTIAGTGGSGDFGWGVYLVDAGTTVVTADGALSITGTGGVGSATFFSGTGVIVDVDATVQVGGTGALTITGTGVGSTGTDNYGVDLVDGVTVSANAGGVTINGTGGVGTGGANHGVTIETSATVVAASGGAVSVTGTAGAKADSLATRIIDVSVVKTTGGGNVSFIGDSFRLDPDSDVDAGSAEVRIVAKTAATTFDLGGVDAAGTLGLTDAEVDRIKAGVIRVGDATTTGSVTVSAAFSPGKAATLALRTTGNILDGAAGAIDATNLVLRGNGITLDSGLHMADNIAASAAGSFVTSFIYDGATALDVESLDGLTGIAATAGGIKASVAAGNLTLNQLVSAAAGSNVGLFATTGAIVDGNGTAVNVVAADFQALAKTGLDVDLTAATTTVAVTGPTGNINVSDSGGGLSVASAKFTDAAATGTLTLAAAGGTLTLGTLVAAPGKSITLTTTTAGDIVVNGPVSESDGSAASGTVSITSAGNLDANTNLGGGAVSLIGGAITLDADQTPSGGFNAFGTAITLGAGVTLTVAAGKILQLQAKATGATIDTSAGDLVAPGGVLLTGNAGADTIIIGAHTAAVFAGGNGGDDTLRIDLSGGGTLKAAVSFVGGGGTSDRAGVFGDGTQTANLLLTPNKAPNPTDVGQGVVTLGAADFTFRQLTPVDFADLAVVEVKFDFAGVKAAVTGGKDSGGAVDAVVISPSAGGTAFETVHAWNNGRVIIDTTTVAGVDVVTFASPAATNAHMNDSLKVVTGSAAGDTAAFTASVTFATDIDIAADTITVAAGQTVLASTGDLTFAGVAGITNDGTVQAGSDITLTASTGSVTTATTIGALSATITGNTDATATTTTATGPVAITATTGAAKTTGVTTSNDSTVTIAAAKTLTVGGNISAVIGVSLTTGPASADVQDITVGAFTVESDTTSVTIAAADAYIGGAATITAATTVTISAGTTATTGTTTGGGAVLLTAGKTLALTGPTTSTGADVKATGATGLTASDDVTAKLGVSLNTGPDVAGAQHLVITAGATIESTTATVTLSSADDIDANGALLISAATTVTMLIDVGASEGTGGFARLVGPDIVAPGGATLAGDGENDTFIVSKYKAALAIDGKAPVAPTLPGDTVTLDGGAAKTKVTTNGLVDAKFTGGGLITFTSIESLTFLNVPDIVVGGGAGDDVLILDSNGGAPFYQLNGGAKVSLPVPLTSFAFNGGDGDDRLDVRVATGDDFADIAGAIGFDGQGMDAAADIDSLIVRGKGQIAVVNLAPTAGDRGLGSVTVGGAKLTFAELEPVDITGMALVTVTFAGAADAVQLDGKTLFADPLVKALAVTGTTGGLVFEDVFLAGNAAVVIDTRTVAGADTVTVNDISNGHANPNLTITTGVEAGDLVSVAAGTTAVTGDFVIDTFAATFTGDTGAGGAVTVTTAGGIDNTAAVTAGALLTFDAAGDVTSKTLTGGTGVTVTGNNVTSTTATATAGNVTLTAAATLDSGTATATAADVVLTGVDILSGAATAPAGRVLLTASKTIVSGVASAGKGTGPVVVFTAGTDITSTTATATNAAGGDVVFLASAGFVNAATTASTGGGISFTAKTSVDSTTATAKGDIGFVAQTADIAVGTKSVSTAGAITYTAKTDITSPLADAKGAVTFEAQTGKIAATTTKAGASVGFTAATDIASGTATAGADATFTAGKNVTSGTATAGGKIAFTATAGAIAETVTSDAGAGIVYVAGTDITSKLTDATTDVSFTAAGKIVAATTVAGGKITFGAGTSITSDTATAGGAVAFTAGTFVMVTTKTESTGGAVTYKAGTDITSPLATAKTDATFTATAGKIVAGTTTAGGKITFGAGTSVASDTASAGGDAAFTAGTFISVGTKTVSTAGAVTYKAGTDITSPLATAKTDATFTATAGKIVATTTTAGGTEIR